MNDIESESESNILCCRSTARQNVWRKHRNRFFFRKSMFRVLFNDWLFWDCWTASDLRVSSAFFLRFCGTSFFRVRPWTDVPSPDNQSPLPAVRGRSSKSISRSSKCTCVFYVLEFDRMSGYMISEFGNPSPELARQHRNRRPVSDRRWFGVGQNSELTGKWWPMVAEGLLRWSSKLESWWWENHEGDECEEEDRKRIKEIEKKMKEKGKT